MMNQINQGAANLPEPTREEILIGRIIDGEAFEDDWNEFDVLAKGDPALLARLARAQREHARLEHDVADSIAVCDLIDLPGTSAHGAAMAARLRQYSGWAVAAVVSLAFLTVLGVNLPGGSGNPNQASIVPVSATPDEAFSEYMRTGIADGRVIGEMPTVLMDVQQLPENEGMQVVYLRQIVERTTVTDLSVLDVQRDEFGNPRYVPTPVRRVAARDTGRRY